MKPTAEDLKLVAEAQGYETEVYLDELCIVIPDAFTYGGKPLLKRLCPTEDAEQCILILEWFGIHSGQNKVNKVWYAYADDEITPSIHKDFKTAVFLAALEYCKKQQTQ